MSVLPVVVVLPPESERLNKLGHVVLWGEYLVRRVLRPWMEARGLVLSGLPSIEVE